MNYLLTGKINKIDFNTIFEKIPALAHLLQENYIDIDCTDKSFLSTLQTSIQHTNLYQQKNIVLLNAHVLLKNHIQYLRKLLSIESVNYYIFSNNMVNHQIAKLCKIIFLPIFLQDVKQEQKEDQIAKNHTNTLLCVKYLRTKSRAEFAAHIWSIYSNDIGEEEFNSIGQFLEDSFFKASKQKPAAVPQILYLWEHWHRFYTMNTQAILTPIQSLKAYLHILDTGYFL